MGAACRTRAVAHVGHPHPAGSGVAGYDADVMQLVHEREVAFIGHDE